MARYNYRAINGSGRTVKGVLKADSELDLYSQLQGMGSELVSCSEIKEGGGGIDLALPGKGVKVRDLIQLFIHMEQMQSAGVPLLNALSDIRASAETQKMRDILSNIYDAVLSGSSLSEAMSHHQNVFKPIYLSLVEAGEQTGNLSFAYKQLIKYLKWVDKMQTMVRKATRYPMIVTVIVFGVIFVMMKFVVPNIIEFIQEDIGKELPFVTVTLIWASDLFRDYWYLLLGIPIGAVIILMSFYKSSEGFAKSVDGLKLRLPVLGNLERKISIARYTQTFGAMFASGINVIKGLRAANQTVTNRVLSEAIEAVEANVREGMPLSQAFNESGEFPSLVIHMIKVGEETGNLKDVMDQVSEFYTADVDEAVQGMIMSIEPALTAVLGAMILWIAVGVFLPIYGSFGDLPI